MRPRTLIILIALVVAVGSAVLLYTRDTPERRMIARVEQLELALSSAPGLDAQRHAERVDRVFDEAIAADVVIAIPDFPELTRGRTGLSYIAKRALSDPRGLDVRALINDLKLDPDGNAATALVRAEIGRPGDELHKDVREVTLRFAKGDGEWRVTSVVVAPKTHEEPEARP
jgi:hypothetical protein